MFELDALSNSDGSRGGDCGRHDDLDEDGNGLYGGGDDSESPRGLTACSLARSEAQGLHSGLQELDQVTVLELLLLKVL